MFKVFTLNSRIDAKLAEKLGPKTRQQKNEEEEVGKDKKPQNKKLQKKKRPTTVKKTSSSFSLSCLSLPKSPRQSTGQRKISRVTQQKQQQQQQRQGRSKENKTKIKKPSSNSSSATSTTLSPSTSASSSSSRTCSPPKNTTKKRALEAAARHQKQQELLAQHIGHAITTQATLLLPTTNPLLKRYTSFHLQNTRITCPSLDALEDKVVDRVMFFSRLMGVRIGGGTVVVEQGEGKDGLVEAVQDIGHRVAGWVEEERDRMVDQEWEDGRVGRKDGRRNCGIWGDLVGKVEQELVDTRDGRRNCGIWEDLGGRGVVEGEGEGGSDVGDEDDWYDAESEWSSS